MSKCCPVEQAQAIVRVPVGLEHVSIMMKAISKNVFTKYSERDKLDLPRDKRPMNKDLKGRKKFNVSRRGGETVT